MQRLRRVSASVGLVATLATTVACTAQGEDRSSSDTLRIVGPFEVHSLDPTASSGIFTRLEVTETLVTSDLDGELAPGLATAWDDSRDGRRWTFELIEDVTFHDGTAMTPDAVADALTTAAAEAASPLAEAPIEEIVAEESAVRFDLAAPYPTLPALLTHYSAAVLAPASYDEDGHVAEVIGTGPYEIESVELPAAISVTRSDEWRGEPPAVENITFQAVGRAESRALMAVSDQADVVFDIDPAGRERVAASDGVGMESSLQPRTLMLKVNADHPVLGDVRVRRAISLALDREAMAEAILRERDLAATQLMPPSLTNWNQPDLAPLAHDQEQARRLLADAGWTEGSGGVLQRDGEPLRLSLVTYPDRSELPALATTIQAALRDIGIDLEVDVTNSSEIPAGHADGTLELALLARHFALVADPLVTVAEVLAPDGSDWGAMNWSDSAVTAAIEELLNAPSDEAAAAARATIVGTVQEELPLIPVAWYRMNAAVSERVDGFVMDPLERTWRVSQLRWAS